MNIQKLITDVEAFAAQIGKTPEYVCRKATNHAFLFQRLKNRREQSERDEKRIRDFMASYGHVDCANTQKPNNPAQPLQGQRDE